MSGNVLSGAGIGTIRIGLKQSLIRSVRRMVTAACGAGAPRGSTSRGTCGLRTGSVVEPARPVRRHRLSLCAARAASLEFFVPLAPCLVLLARSASAPHVTIVIVVTHVSFVMRVKITTTHGTIVCSAPVPRVLCSLRCVSAVAWHGVVCGWA